MPYFLNAPASMATKSGACSSDTAGTATLIVFSGVSAPDDEAEGNSTKAIREIRIVHRLIVRSFSQLVYDRLPQAGENVQLGFEFDAEPVTAGDC
jgi:hypothetical protein